MNWLQAIIDGGSIGSYNKRVLVFHEGEFKLPVILHVREITDKANT